MEKIKNVLSIVLVLFVFKGLSAQEEGFVYLSDFVIKNQQINFGGIIGVGLDHPWEVPDKKLTINGVEYEKGLGTRSSWRDSYIEYELNKQFTKFTAIVGLDDLSLYNFEGEQFQYPFEWILIDTAGNYIRQYRGCRGNEKPDVCDVMDYMVPFIPGTDDKNNDWVEYYVNNSPDRRIVMTRPACQARVYLDETETYNKYFSKSESYNSPADTIEFDLTDKDMLKLDIGSDGIQYDPFDEPFLVKENAWRDYLNWVDAKLYYKKSVTGIVIDEQEVIMEQQNIAFIKAEVFPSDAIMTYYKIKSSKPHIVEVLNEAEGRVWAHRPGEATITVTTIDGGYKDSCTVYVQGDNSINIKSIQKGEVKITNPAAVNNICIEWDDENYSDCLIQILNLQGKMIWKGKNVRSNQCTLNLEGIIDKGLYIINFSSGKYSVSKKLVVK